MTTSGTTSFSIGRDEVIASALRLCGVLAEGQTASTQQKSDCAEALNLLLKSYGTKGWLLWVYEKLTVPLTSGLATYTVGPTGALVANRPIRLAQAYIRNIDVTPNFDTPLIMLTRQQYEMLTPKGVAGQPNSFYYEQQLGSSTAPGYGTIYLWPVYNASPNSVLVVNSQRPIQDIASGGTASTQQFDIPQEWFLALKWQLASEIGPEYGVTERTQQRIDQKADFYLREVVDFSTAEEPSVYFQPSPQIG